VHLLDSPIIIASFLDFVKRDLEKSHDSHRVLS